MEYPGAIYHVMNRGDRREEIFKDEQDRQRFLETLGEVCARTGWQVHAWVWMSNHSPARVASPAFGKLFVGAILRLRLQAAVSESASPVTP